MGSDAQKNTVDLPSERRVIRTVGCFIEQNGLILVLLRQPHKPEPSTWGLPAGKVDENEDYLETARRELFEETGIQLTEQQLDYMGVHIFDFDELTVVFPVYRHVLDSEIVVSVTINPEEHADYAWMSARQIADLENPIHGLVELLDRLNYLD